MEVRVCRTSVLYVRFVALSHTRLAFVEPPASLCLRLGVIIKKRKVKGAKKEKKRLSFTITQRQRNSLTSREQVINCIRGFTCSLLTRILWIFCFWNFLFNIFQPTINCGNRIRGYKGFTIYYMNIYIDIHTHQWCVLLTLANDY